MMASRDFVGITEAIHNTFLSLDSLMEIFIPDNNDFDIPASLEFFTTIQSYENDSTVQLVLEKLLNQIEQTPLLITPQNVCSLLPIIYLPLLGEPESSMVLMPKICRVLNNLTEECSLLLAKCLKESVYTYGKEKYFKLLVLVFQQYLSLQVLAEAKVKLATGTVKSKTVDTDPLVVCGVKTLAILCTEPF